MKHCLPLLLALFGATTTAYAENWSSWRGPEQTGVSRDRDLPDTFSIDPKAKNGNVIWKAPYGGITTPVVQNGRVFLINKVGENVSQQERVMCFDADTGKLLWEHKFNVFLTDIVADRLGWTQMVGDPETGNVYAHGTQGFLFCFDKDGKVLWQHSLTEEYGRISGYGGRIMSPIVFENLVIMPMINANWGEQTVGGTRLAAFDKRTGDVVWWASSGYRVRDTNACVPVVAYIGGQWLVLCGGGDGGLHAFKARTGEKMWSYIFGGGAVNASPVVEGDRVYAGHGEANTDSDEPGPGHLPGRRQDRGRQAEAGVESGRHQGQIRLAAPPRRPALRVQHHRRDVLPRRQDRQGTVELPVRQQHTGSPVWADGKIYIPELDSQFHILKPGANACQELCAVEFRGKGVAPVELTGSPAVANGRVYFLTSEELFCIGKKEVSTISTTRIREAKGERMAPEGTQAAHLQVVPADVALTPGQSVTFKALAYDDRGRLIGEVKADWSLAGSLPPVFPIGFPTPPPPKTKPTPPPALQGHLSTMSGTSTKLTVGNSPPPAQFGRVVAKVGDLTAYVRVRVAPLLPYANDFAKVPIGRTPGGWVNCQGKFAVAKMKDGTLALKKRNDAPSPLVAGATPTSVCRG